MKSTLFIPKKIKVGFNEREDTYTGKLAYIIYYDQKGKLRKEASWNGWKDDKIPVMDIDNTPRSGFVLNKKVGGGNYSGWNSRNTYCRVFDPEGFEFEITIQNLLYILENTNSFKGKGLEGDFVYSWEGKDLVLMPTSSPDYAELEKYNEKIHQVKKYKGKDLKIGATYLNKDNKELVYIGRFDEYEYWSWCVDNKNKGKRYWFNVKGTNFFEKIKTLSGIVIDTISEECVDNYSEIFEKMESKPSYSPLDETKYLYDEFTLDELEESLSSDEEEYYYESVCVYIKRGNEYIKHHIDYHINYVDREYKYELECDDVTSEYHYSKNKYDGSCKQFNSIEEILEKHILYKERKFLTNGREYNEK